MPIVKLEQRLPAEYWTGKGYIIKCKEIYLSRAATTGLYIHDLSHPSTQVGSHRKSTLGCDSGCMR